MITKRWMSIVTGLILLGFFFSISISKEPVTIWQHSPQKISQAQTASYTHLNRINRTSVAHEVTATANASADVHTHERLRLVPSGQSIGVKMNTNGVLVVGYHLVNGKQGQISPAENAGIQIGDVITKINGKQTESIADIKQLMNHFSSEKPLKMTVLRHKKKLEKELTPALSKESSQPQLGLYIRDTASGIGTMTFFDPETSAYGALGHVISDRDTGQPIQINGGKIVRSTVQAIDRGEEGKPGEKIAFFPEDALSIGSVDKNTPFGIYGHLRNSSWNRSQKALPIGLTHEVKEGPAKILTVLEGDKVEAFDIRILNSVPQKYPATKGLVIKITDPRLLKVTGGIIQGMSGSPIIQNGKIIGAVTHVFVSDPTSGYGVHIEWMLKEAGLTADPQDVKEEEKAS